MLWRIIAIYKAGYGALWRVTRCEIFYFFISNLWPIQLNTNDSNFSFKMGIHQPQVEDGKILFVD